MRSQHKGHARPSFAAVKSDHILIVDTHDEACGALTDYLRKNGYRTSIAASVGGARDLLQSDCVDLAILDIMLPADDCLSLCRYLRATSTMPIILLTAMAEGDGILGKECDADDYIIKPYNHRELLARIKTVLSSGWDAPRPRIPATGSILFGDWILDIERRQLLGRKRTVVPLGNGEFLLLHALLTHAQRVLRREQLLILTQDCGKRLLECSVDAQISRLRRKIEPDPENPKLIRTVPGGYMCTASVEICNEPAFLLSNRFG